MYTNGYVCNAQYTLTLFYVSFIAGGNSDDEFPFFLPDHDDNTTSYALLSLS